MTKLIINNKNTNTYYYSLSLTLNVTDNLILWDVNFLKRLANLSLPQRNNFIEGHDIGRRSNVKGSIQSFGIVHCSYCVRSNIPFIVENC